MREMNSSVSLWRYVAEEGALIWQLMFTESGVVVAQKRFPEERRSLFFALEAVSGEVLFDDYRLPDGDGNAESGEEWLTGIETVAGELVFFHAYRQGGPEHLGLWAVDAGSGRVVWSRRDIVFTGVIDEGFLVYRPSSFAGFPERTYLVIDHRSGADLRFLGADHPEIVRLRCDLISEERRQGVLLPELLEGGDPRFAGMSGSDRVSPHRCEGLAAGPVAIVATHHCDTASGLWQSGLRVWRNGLLLHEDCLAESSRFPMLNSFLLRAGRLYYLKRQSELLSLEL